MDNDCVIVPDFGGFVAYWVPAHYDESDRTFLPPTRTLGFNSQLRMNDSLLVQSYIEAYDISYPEALRRIESDTNDLRQQLENEGRYVLEDLGTLTVNMEGSYEFEPFKSGLLSPDIYGLSSVPFKRLHDDAVASQEAPAVNADDKKEEAETATPALLDFMTDDEDDSKAISIKMSWVRNAVAIAAAVVAFFMFATPVVNSDLGSKSMSQLQGNLLYKLMPKDTNSAPAQPMIAEDKHEATAHAVETAPKETPKQEVAKPTEAAIPVEAAKPANTTHKYCIVVASQVRKSNAEEFVERLHKQGYADAEVYIHHNIVRVICGAFDSEAEAYNRLNKLNNKEEFAEAWVYKM